MMSMKDQIRRNAGSLTLVYGLGLAAVVAVWMVGARVPGGIAMLMRDTTQTLDAPFYIGFVSNLGMVFWCSAAAVCLFAGAVLRRMEGPSAWTYFFGFAGLLTAILFIDDFFLIHDEVVPKHLFPKKGPLHLNEKVVLGVYAIIAITFLWKCRETILRRTDWLLLALALGLMALSVISERSFTKAFIPTKELRTLAEDGFKLLGILGWCFYFVRTAVQVVSAPRAATGGAGSRQSESGRGASTSN